MANDHSPGFLALVDDAKNRVQDISASCPLEAQNLGSR